jgi:hypothetical protein
VSRIREKNTGENAAYLSVPRDKRRLYEKDFSRWVAHGKAKDHMLLRKDQSSPLGIG